MEGEIKGRACPATEFTVFLYSDLGRPTFKFWTYEAAYALETLRGPTVSPQTEWG